MTLIEYIEKHHNGSQAEFARANEIHRSQVTQWINKNFIVINGVMYSPRRKLEEERSPERGDRSKSQA